MEVMAVIDELTRAEIARDHRIYDGCKLPEVYGVGCERMVLGIIIEAMLSAGYRKGRIAYVLNEAIEAMDDLSVKEFQDIDIDFVSNKYKKSKRN